MMDDPGFSIYANVIIIRMCVCEGRVALGCYINEEIYDVWSEN